MQADMIELKQEFKGLRSSVGNVSEQLETITKVCKDICFKYIFINPLSVNI